MNKTALITGASSGIGKDLAYIHAEHGGGLILVARREDRLNDIKKELEDKHSIDVSVIVKDLSKIESAQEVYDEVKSANIEVDYLINNAGFGGSGKFYQRPWEQDLAMIQLNIISLSALTRLFLPDFVEKNSGRILNLSSIASLMPGPFQAVYFATKAYVSSFSYALAEELRDTNITVTAVLPGATETEFGRIAEVDKTDLFKHTASSYGVAQDGYNAMLAGKLNVMTGVSWGQRLTMAMIPYLPKKMVMKQVRQLQGKS
jgi:uncharacterized protein